MLFEPQLGSILGRNGNCRRERRSTAEVLRHAVPRSYCACQSTASTSCLRRRSGSVEKLRIGHFHLRAHAAAEPRLAGFLRILGCRTLRAGPDAGSTPAMPTPASPTRASCRLQIGSGGNIGPILPIQESSFKVYLSQTTSLLGALADTDRERRLFQPGTGAAASRGGRSALRCAPLPEGGLQSARSRLRT